MGTVYYLWRDDTREAYELGKSWHWEEVFVAHPGRSEPMLVTVNEVDTLAELLCAAEAQYGSALKPDEIDYFTWVARDIVRWSEGRLFEFVSEHDGRIESAQMEGWDERPPRHREYITGSRYQDARLPAH